MIIILGTANAMIHKNPPSQEFFSSHFWDLKDSPKLTHVYQSFCCSHNKLCYDYSTIASVHTIDMSQF